MAEKRKSLLEKFVNEHRDWSDKDIQLAQVFYLKQIVDRTERTRYNTATIVTIAVLLIILSVLTGLLGLLGIASI